MIRLRTAARLVVAKFGGDAATQPFHLAAKLLLSVDDVLALSRQSLKEVAILLGGPMGKCAVFLFIEK